MTINFKARKVNLRDSFKERTEKKLKKFDKFFDENAEATVLVSLERDRQTVEVTINNNGMIYRAEDTTQDMDESLDKVIDLLTRQIRKNKTKLEKRVRDAQAFDAFASLAPDYDDVEEEDLKIVRVKKFSVKPMDPEEAVLQMNLLGHQFYIFRNVDTGEVNVVYKRKNGDYGLLEPSED
ncbi:MAG: ribosome-associated translation inhibitor RaiA [Clostridia bacterium]|nr:ribosome-associated translation inhibitor RaiA [Clostridia bacterium]